MTKRFLALSIRILLIGITVLIFFGGDKVGAQTKEQLCAQYSADQNTYECCMTHTSQNFEECFSEDGSSSEQLPDVPDVGEGVCAWRDANGNRCDETTQYCAEGCPPRRGVVPDNQVDEEKETAEEGPLTKRFVALDKIAIPILPKSIDESIPSAKFEFSFGNIKKGESVNAVFSGGPPEVLPVQSIIFTPSADIDDGSLTVTIADGLRPELLGKGAPGTPDYDRPIVPPDPKVYELKDYIRIDAKMSLKSGYGNTVNTTEYEAAPISEALFKMVTSLIPKKEGFDNPETEVVFLHLNKDTNKWDPLVTEKGTECLFDKTMCTFTALSPGFSVFAIALKKPDSSNIYLWVAVIIVWTNAIIFFYFKFLKENFVDKLKGISKSERVKVIKEIGFKKYVLIQGILYGNILAMTHTIISIISHKITLTRFIEIYLTDFVVGLGIGAVLWIIATRKPKEA